MKVIISGGGTGGHIYPAIAIANELKRQQPTAEILFVGAKGKMEMEKVPKAGYPIEGLWISGFHRKLTLRNLLFPIKLISSLWKARRILKRFQPDIAVGVGGFASGPILEMAYRLGIPSLIQEQNSYAGVTNRLLAKKVDRVCVAYHNMERFFPKTKLKRTGNPVRSDIMDLENRKLEASQHFQLDKKKQTVLLFGGSLGARTLNEAMAKNTALIAKQKAVQFIWQAGQLYIDAYQQSKTAQLPNVQIRPFLDRMDLAYAAADVIICRAGALTISELSLVGKPSILIPSPNVAEDHQTQNAKALVEKEAALLIKDKDAAEQMIPTVLDLLEQPDKQYQLSQQLRLLAKPTAAQEIVAEVLDLGLKKFRNS